MSLRKKLSKLFICGSVVSAMLMSQSAFAATEIAVSPEPQSESQLSTNTNMWFVLSNLQAWNYYMSIGNGYVYNSPSSHQAKLAVYQKPATQGGSSPTVRYTVVKSNSSGSPQSYTLTGETTLNQMVQLDQGTYYVFVENISNSDAYVHVILGNN
ncbi:hypothetical protein AMS62_00570 [Bacillus sp. FJAT-18019]|nr:hypothetical protein AMS62_00570 [Bacillus sp. FJAT-18019]